MEPFQQRVVEEKLELDNNILNLRTVRITDSGKGTK